MKNRLKRSDLLYPDLSYQIVGALFEVYNDLGYGYQEKYYQKAVSVRLKEVGLSFKEQAPVKIHYKDNKIGVFFLDFLIEDKIILEIKKGDKFLKSNIDQLYAYLKSTGLKLGVLANFAKKGVEFKRVVNINSNS